MLTQKTIPKSDQSAWLVNRKLTGLAAGPIFKQCLADDEAAKVA